MKPEEARPERTPSLPLDCVQSEPQGGPSRIRACSLWRTKGECELDRIAEELGLEEGARKQARSVCYAVTGQRLVRGRTIGVVAACSVYVVCREARLPITLKVLATSCNSTPG